MTKTNSRYRLADLAERFQLQLHGDADHEVSSVGTLASSASHQISFLSNKAYQAQLGGTNAGAVILSEADAEHCPVNCLVAGNPYTSYAKVAALFDFRTAAQAGIHPSAQVSSSATIDSTASIGANAVIGDEVIIGPGCDIGAGCVIGNGSTVGAETTMLPNVVICELCTIGSRVLIHPGAVIGSDGFGIAFDQGNWIKVPQLGSVSIGDDCEIGANATIDRGAIDDTRLGNDVRLDNMVHIAHNVVIGDHTAIAACTGIAGSTRVGRNCLIAGGVGMLGHLEIADNVTIGAMSYVSRSITEKGSMWASGVPSRPLKEWQRNQTHLRKLDQIVNRIRTLESKIGKTENNE